MSTAVGVGRSCVKHCVPATGYSGSVSQGRGRGRSKEEGQGASFMMQGSERCTRVSGCKDRGTGTFYLYVYHTCTQTLTQTHMMPCQEVYKQVRVPVGVKTWILALATSLSHMHVPTH